MAVTKKSKKSSKPKKVSKPKKQSKKKIQINLFIKLMLIILFVSVIMTSILLVVKSFKNAGVEEVNMPDMQEKVISEVKEQVVSEAKKQETIVDLKKVFKENHTLNGCWFSTLQGSALTMDEYGYRIDFSGVDASEPIVGKYSVDGNQIIFFNVESECEGIEGVYKITFNTRDISLVCKDDDCIKRKNVLEAGWEWLEL